MERIRNHAQHCDQPISSITFSGRRDVQEGAPRIHSIRMSVRMERLVAAGKVKSEILDEIPEDNGLIHLGPHVRDYVTGLIKVQKKVRDSLSKETARYEGEFERLIGLMPKTDRSRYKSIRWRCTGDDGEIDEEVVLLEDHISRIKELERRNRYSGELSTLIVTSGDTA